MILYHYTCADAAPKIEAAGRVVPNRAGCVLLGVALAWFTDLTQPDRSALRLTSETGLFSCDRTEWRVTVDASPTTVYWWPAYRRAFVRDQGIPQKYRDRALDLETAAGARPVHWYVSETAVPIRSVEPVRAAPAP